MSFDFLDRVRVSAYLVRMHQTTDREGINRKWIARKEDFSGVIIGKRTLSNGCRYYDDYGYQYQKLEHFTAYLVVADMSHNPVYVLADDMEREK